jgi:hypothetical protein
MDMDFPPRNDRSHQPCKRRGGETSFPTYLFRGIIPSDYQFYQEQPGKLLLEMWAFPEGIFNVSK